MRRHPFLNPNSILLTLLAVTPLAAENPPATLVKAKVTQTAGQDNQSDSRQILTQWAAASSFLSPIGPQST
ncbi:MAG TPA: hypothetical protein DDZ90_24815, partial [Planctomycetaceae bacterium]|nr:hypothetical protein [Planctomycetaceae bacterium]